MKDLISIGSTGFAQFGEADYEAKASSEGKILKDYFLKHFPVPEEYTPYCHYQWKYLSYDEDHYYELALCFNESAMEQHENPFFLEDFWEFVTLATSVYLDEDPFQQMAKDEYLRRIQENEIPPAALSAVA